MFSVIVEGDLACFTRPECKAERMSYPVPTPSALEGLIKAVYWKPAISYVVDRVVVYHPISYLSISANEISGKVSITKLKNIMWGKEYGTPFKSTADVMPRTTTYLRNVKYGIEFHFLMTGEVTALGDENPAKHAAMLERRLRLGQFTAVPYLGLKECPAKKISLVDSLDLSGVDERLMGVKDLGVMLYGLRFGDAVAVKKTRDSKFITDAARPKFYHPSMSDGVIDVEKYRRETLC